MAEQPQQAAQGLCQLPAAAVQDAFQRSLVGLTAGFCLGVLLVQFADLLLQRGNGLLLCGEGYRLRDGILEQLTRNGDVLDIAELN